MDQSNIILSSAQEISTAAEDFYRDYWQPQQSVSPLRSMIEQRQHFIIHTLMTHTGVYGRVIELGVGGEGGIISALRSSAEVCGLDISDSAIEGCRNLGIPAIKLNCDNTPLPFENDCIDTVIALEVFEHFSNPQFVLEEIRRVLKPDGLFIASTPSPYTYHWPRLFYPDLFTQTGFTDFLLANRFQCKLHADPFCQNCYKKEQHHSTVETSFSLYWQAAKIADHDLYSLHSAAQELFNRRDSQGRRIRPIEALDLLKRCMQIDASSLSLQTDYLCALFYRAINNDTKEFYEQIGNLMQHTFHGESPMKYAQALLQIHHEAEELGRRFLDDGILHTLISFSCHDRH